MKIRLNMKRACQVVISCFLVVILAEMPASEVNLISVLCFYAVLGHECGPCAEKCKVSCEHNTRGCKRCCKEMCRPCEKECSWSCEHQGKCGLSCGAPCDRLPCDLRCEKQLSCGCRCPFVCGERCPPRKLCRVHGLEKNKSTVSILASSKRYFLMQTVGSVAPRIYSEISDEELTQNPLIWLNCGNVFFMSDLDEHMGLRDFYEWDPSQK